MMPLNSTSNYFSHCFASPYDDENYYYCTSGRHITPSTKSRQTLNYNEHPQQKNLRQTKHRQYDQQQQRQSQQPSKAFKTVLSYGPYGELYSVQVPMDLRTSSGHYEKQYKQQEDFNAPSNECIKEKEEPIVGMETSTAAKPPSSSTADVGMERRPHQLISPHSDGKCSSKLTTAIFIEDVTEEELSDEMRNKYNPYAPGPGESWMEPVDPN